MMTLLEKENVIRRLMGKADVSGSLSKSGRLMIWDAETQACQLPYYGDENSIGIVLRDVVPMLEMNMTTVFESDGSGIAIRDDDADPYKIYVRGGKPCVDFSTLSSMPAACCDALLRKEGLI